MGMLPESEIIRVHAHHAPKTEATAELHDAVRTKFTELALWCNEHVPAGFELSKVLTEIRSARQWANAAVALHDGRE